MGVGGLVGVGGIGVRVGGTGVMVGRGEAVGNAGLGAQATNPSANTLDTKPIFEPLERRYFITTTSLG